MSAAFQTTEYLGKGQEIFFRIPGRGGRITISSLSSPGLTKMLDIDLLAYLFSKNEFEMVKALCASEQCLIQGQ